MLCCLRQCVFTAQTCYSKEILSMALFKGDLPPCPSFIYLFFLIQNIQFLRQSNLQNTKPTNHRITFALKQRCSYFFLLLHCKTFLSKIVSVCQLPVWKLLHKTHMHCNYSTVFYHPTQSNDWNKKHFWQPVFSKSLMTFKNHNM